MKRAPLTPSQIASFTKTVVSTDVPLTVLEQRLTVCRSCEYHEMRDGHLHCGACGCPSWRASRMSYKAKKKGARCPKGKWHE